MARDPNKPVAIYVDGRGYTFTSSIKGAEIDTSLECFSGDDFYADWENVDEIRIIKPPAYKGAMRNDQAIYRSLKNLARTRYGNPQGWIWAENEGFNKEKRVAERKAKKARAASKGQSNTTESE